MPDSLYVWLPPLSLLSCCVSFVSVLVSLFSFAFSCFLFVAACCCLLQALGVLLTLAGIESMGIDAARLLSTCCGTPMTACVCRLSALSF